MVFWKKKRKQHNLPKFPDTVIPTFKHLSEAIPSDEIEELRKKVEFCYNGFVETSRKDETFDLKSAQDLVNCCHFLLNSYDDYNDDLKAQVIGAVRYFAIADDPFDDATFASGFHDDKKIMNYVLEELEIHDRYLDL